LQAKPYGVDRESGVVFLAGEPFLLCCGYNHAIPDQAGRAVVIISRYAENMSQTMLRDGPLSEGACGPEFKELYGADRPLSTEGTAFKVSYLSKFK
jgi:hypothetical protein